MGTTAKRPVLTILLAGMLTRAEQSPGVPQRSSLGRHLLVELLITTDGVLRLQISRADVPPSRTEWNTVLKHYPHPLPETVLTIEQTYHGRHYIRTAFPFTKLPQPLL